MPDYHPLAELAPRDVVSRAIFHQMQMHDQHCVYLDLNQLEVPIPKRFPTIYQRCLDAKLDITKDMIPVAPAAHYCIGGVETTKDAQTAVPGLYAAGEVAATGIHGANRLASNSLLEGLVFGHRAAKAMITDSHLNALPPVLESLNLDQGPTKTPDQIAIIRQKIRRLMWKYVGICRDEAGLSKALATLHTFDDYKNYTGLEESQLTLKNMIVLAEHICQSALDRRDSVGAHFRLDDVKNEKTSNIQAISRTA
tara:strand:- start:1521 stop:2279 length:759 start_codon:yes stop_codon:yes gene_type:complete